MITARSVGSAFVGSVVCLHSIGAWFDGPCLIPLALAALDFHSNIDEVCSRNFERSFKVTNCVYLRTNVLLRLITGSQPCKNLATHCTTISSKSMYCHDKCRRVQIREISSFCTYEHRHFQKSRSTRLWKCSCNDQR